MATWKEIRERRVGDNAELEQSIRRERFLLDMEVALADLRKQRGISQASVAEVLGTSQPNISRIESEEDVQLSTLAGYIAGIGGTLVIQAVFDDGAVQLTRSHHLSPIAEVQAPIAIANGGKMSKANDTDRYVVPNKDRGGWDIKKEKAGRSSAHTNTKKEAIDRARKIVRNEGGGEIRIANKEGRLIDSDTVRGPKHRESPARDRK